MNSLLTFVCSVRTGKYLPSVFPHKPRSFVAQSLRKPQANAFPHGARSRLINIYCFFIFNQVTLIDERVVFIAN